ncbi:hypothetical protein JCM10908_003820 [Rhodotorula pacifica]|uniref:uncharacterized protein n=1 Tax=Rhodotorula pacifica TaxID=1495444 RepID=UPI00317534FA
MSGPASSSREPSTDARPPPPPYASIAQPLENRPFPDRATQGPTRTSRATDALFDHEWAQLGFPTGYFLLRNAAQGKTLDLIGHRQDEGAELGLHPIKQPLLQGVSLQHKGNNQVFFVDWSGHLVSGASSRPIDVEDSRLVQAFPHPVMTLHSRLSHPPARFRLDPSTSTLHVLFDSDPFFSGPNGSDDWRSHDYIVEAVPRKRKSAGNSAWSTASEQAGHVLSGLGSTAATLGEKLSVFGLFSGSRSGSTATSKTTSPKMGNEPQFASTHGADVSEPTSTDPAAQSATVSSGSGASAEADPSSDEEPPTASTAQRVLHVEHDPEPDPDSDSESTAYRALRVVRLEPGWREKYPAEALRAAPDKSFGVTRWSSSPKELRKWRRRMWDVIPVTIKRLPAPDFPVHHAGPAGETAPMSAAESQSASASVSASESHEDGSSQDEERYTEEEDDEHAARQHLAPPDSYAMADYFGIGSHETSGASSPVESRSRRPSAHTAMGPVGAHDTRRWSATETLANIPPMTAAAASHLSGLLSSRLLPLSLAPGDIGELADGEGTDGEPTTVQATPKLPEDEWDANEVGRRELDLLARERQSSASEDTSAGEWESDAETPRLETGPARRVKRAAAPRQVPAPAPPIPTLPAENK